MFRFKCVSCSEWHEGVPGFGWSTPLVYYAIPEAERSTRVELTEDTCIVDGKHFFVKGCIEIPVHGADEPFVWGVWVSLSQRNFEQFVGLFDRKDRAQYGPYFGWLSAYFTVYPDAEALKTTVHLRDDGMRPYIELQSTDHPLAIEQRDGISVDRLAEIYAAYMH